MDKKLCPICERQCGDIIKHFAIVHEIEDINQLKKEIEKANNRNERCRKFSEYVESLKEKIKTGKITSKDYRELTTKWSEEYPKNGEENEKDCS